MLHPEERVPISNRVTDLVHGDDKWSGYPADRLKEWDLAPVVAKHKGMPGEMGKAVVVPKDREEEKKEKFKINQFNLVGSEMLSLNRSLQDVRLSA